MIPPTHIKEIIEYGTKAPSGHNTQPWKFLVKENEIQIHPDFTRALSVVDPDNHALYISLGCAAENSVLAANHFGYDCSLEIVLNDENTQFIKLSLKQASNIEKDDLVNFIDTRQSTRNLYSKEVIPDEKLNILQKSFSIEGIKMIIMSSSEEKEKLVPFVIEGSNRQFENKVFVDELVSWIRFSKKEVNHKKDGIWNASMGMPSVGKVIGSLIMKNFVSAKSEAKRWKKQIKASAGFALFTVEKNDVTHWVNLGRAFQRFGLTATKLNINHAHANMPCEEVEVRKKMARHLNLDAHPLLLIRFGYSEKMPYSLRRELNEVIITTNP